MENKTSFPVFTFFYFLLSKTILMLLRPNLSSLVLTGVGAVTVAFSGGWRWVRVHRGRVFVLGASRLDGTQVAVAARPEARGRGQIQSLHCLRSPLTVRHRVAAAVPVYLKERVQTHTLRGRGQTEKHAFTGRGGSLQKRQCNSANDTQLQLESAKCTQRRLSTS